MNDKFWKKVDQTGPLVFVPQRFTFTYIFLYNRCLLECHVRTLKVCIINLKPPCIYRAFYKRWAKVQDVIEYNKINNFHLIMHDHYCNAKLLEVAKSDVVIRVKNTQSAIKWWNQGGNLLCTQSLSLWDFSICNSIDKMHITFSRLVNGNNFRYISTAIDRCTLGSVAFKY